MIVEAWSQGLESTDWAATPWSHPTDATARCLEWQLQRLNNYRLGVSTDFCWGRGHIPVKPAASRRRLSEQRSVINRFTETEKFSWTHEIRYVCHSDHFTLNYMWKQWMWPRTCDACDRWQSSASGWLHYHAVYLSSSPGSNSLFDLLTFFDLCLKIFVFSVKVKVCGTSDTPSVSLSDSQHTCWWGVPQGVRRCVALMARHIVCVIWAPGQDGVASKETINPIK